MWRSNNRRIVRWLWGLFLFAVALAIRFAVGHLHGANPVLTFYAAVLIASVLLGWEQALAVLALAVVTGTYLFLPPGMFLQPVGWVIVGGLNIAIIAALEGMARELAAANERQRLLFQELQHRVANSLQAASGALEIAQRRVEASSADAALILGEAAQRIASSADVHRRLNDPTLFSRDLGSILRDAVSSVINPFQIALAVDVEELDLSFEQMSNLTLLVIEAANNAQKHVFHRGLGSRFSVSLQAMSRDHAVLTVRDDGPGIAESFRSSGDEQGLGFRVIRGLTGQIGGRLTIMPGKGTALIVEFPLGPAKGPADRAASLP